MKPSIESWARRGSRREKDYRWHFVFVLTVLVVSMVINILLPYFLPTAHADIELQWKDVHTEHDACVWMKTHPGRIKNVTWCDL